jgi:hypothetical protein
VNPPSIGAAFAMRRFVKAVVVDLIAHHPQSANGDTSTPKPSRFQPQGPLRGTVKVPGDKSISQHRA